MSGRRMSFNQGGINRQTFGMFGKFAQHGKQHGGSKEDLSSDDPDMRSFNSLTNRFLNN